MKSIYILLTRSDTVLSRIIHLFTAVRYTHVSIAFDGELQSEQINISQTKQKQPANNPAV